MSGRRATAHALGVISGFIIIPASLAGVLLAGPASAASAAANPCAAQLTAVSASTTSPAASPSAASPAPASSTPTPSAASPTPTPSSASPTTSPSSASPTPTPTPSSPTPSPSSSSPSPSPSSSPTSKADTLCLTVQALASSVQPSAQARYAVWVWLAGTVNGTAKVSISAGPGKLTPSFTVCPATGGNSCSVALTAGQAVQLRAAVAVPENATGTHLTLDGDRDLTTVGSFRHGVGQRPGQRGGPNVQCGHTRAHPGRRGRAAARNKPAGRRASVRQAASAAQPGDGPQPELPSGDTLARPFCVFHPGQGQRGVGVVPAQHAPCRRPDHRPGGAGCGDHHRRCPSLAPQAAATAQPGP